MRTMPSILVDCFVVSRTFAFGIFFVAMAQCVADEKEEMAAASSLIAIVEGGKADQAELAKKLFDSIPDESKSKAVAAYSLALVHIREHQNSEAWKLVTAPSKEQDSETDSLQVGKEKLKLWLLLEAGSAAKAEPQFKRLVSMALNAELPIADQTANCSFLGGVIGMLKTDADSSCLPLPLLDKAIEKLQGDVKSKNAIAELENQIDEAGQWGAKLSEQISTFESIGAEKAAEQNKSTQAEYESMKQEQLKLRDDLKTAGGGKRDLEAQRRNAIKEQKIANANLQREKQQKPAQPVHPGPQPRQPDRPTGNYKTDPKTQERKYEEPSAREIRRYEQELAQFTSWPAKIAKFQQEQNAFPAKIQLWQQHVADREAKVKEAMNETASIEKAMKDMQAGIAQGVGNDLKEASDQLDQLEQTASISNIAFAYLTSKDVKNKNAIRPSNFQLIDYPSECTRLRKLLR